MAASKTLLLYLLAKFAAFHKYQCAELKLGKAKLDVIKHSQILFQIYK